MRESANEAEATVKGILKGGTQRLLFDLSRMEYISSAGLRVILMAVKELRNKKGKVVLCGLTPYVKEIFDVSNFLLIIRSPTRSKPDCSRCASRWAPAGRSCFIRRPGRRNLAAAPCGKPNGHSPPPRTDRILQPPSELSSDLGHRPCNLRCAYCLPAKTSPAWRTRRFCATRNPADRPCGAAAGHFQGAGDRRRGRWSAKASMSSWRDSRA